MSISILANGKAYACPTQLSRKLLPKAATSFGPDFTGQVLRAIDDIDAPGGKPGKPGAPWFNGAVITQNGRATHGLVVSEEGMNAFPVFGNAPNVK